MNQAAQQLVETKLCYLKHGLPRVKFKREFKSNIPRFFLSAFLLVPFSKPGVSLNAGLEFQPPKYALSINYMATNGLCLEKIKLIFELQIN
jgi:hypothetical protein